MASSAVAHAGLVGVCQTVLGAGLNVLDDWPQKVAVPAVVIRLRPQGSITPGKALGGGFDNFQFTIDIIVDRAYETATGQTVGDLIARESPLIRALRALRVGTGPCMVTETSVKQRTIGANRYTYARIAVTVKA